jgi:hypothetical protein
VTTVGKVRTAIVLAGVAFALSACSGFKESLGAGKQGPDEMAIATRAPLVVPATFELKPPQPGAPRPQDSDTAAAAQRVLGGVPRSTPAASQGEMELLNSSGAAAADPKVRQALSAEEREAKGRSSYADTVLFWRGRDSDPGTPIDPLDEPYKPGQTQSAASTQSSASETPVAVQPPAPPPAPQAKPDAPESEDASAKPAEEEEKEADEEDSGGWFDWF